MGKPGYSLEKIEKILTEEYRMKPDDIQSAKSVRDSVRYISKEDFEDTVLEMTADGYPYTPEDFQQTVAIDAFLRGCTNKQAALIGHIPLTIFRIGRGTKEVPLKKILPSIASRLSNYGDNFYHNALHISEKKT